MARIRVAAAVVIVAAAGFVSSKLCSAQAVQVRDATGTLVGLYLGPAGYDTNSGLPVAEGSAFRVISATGYTFSIGSGSGVVLRGGAAHPGFGSDRRLRPDVYYESVNCTGPGYGTFENNIDLSLQITGGVVFRVLQGPLYYMPKAAISELRTFRSSGLPAPGACSTGTFTERGIPALPNDPGVTGVSDVQFVAPLTLGLVDSPWLLLRDSFESQAS